MKSHLHYIEEMAMQALQKAGCTQAPVPIKDVAHAVGLEVVEFPFHNKISGLLKKDQGIIGVNKTHHPMRQRFTIAHELGHFLLGHGIGEEYEGEIIDDVFDKPLPVEREANIFASSILMPAEWVKGEIKNSGMKVDHLSEVFGVSKQAMTIRLLELKLI